MRGRNRRERKQSVRVVIVGNVRLFDECYDGKHSRSGWALVDRGPSERASARTASWKVDRLARAARPAPHAPASPLRGIYVIVFN